jgi:uncharacterized SAM-binding protein YcdF (DUF218 family)
MTAHQSNADDTQPMVVLDADCAAADETQFDRSVTLVNHSRKRLAAAVSIVAIIISSIILAYSSRATILTEAATMWSVADRINNEADAIILLGGDEEFRPQVAAKLYLRGLAPIILVSNPKLTLAASLGIEHSDAQKDVQILIRLGVPASAISVFGKNLRNTHEEAQAILQWAKQSRAQAIIIPVEWSFSRRVRWTFRHVLTGAGVDARVYRMDSGEPTPSDWWRTEQGVVAFQNELLKYLYYRMKY